jgi:hypothetical protein
MLETACFQQKEETESSQIAASVLVIFMIQRQKKQMGFRAVTWSDVMSCKRHFQISAELVMMMAIVGAVLCLMYITFLGTNIDVRSVIFDTPSDVASH